MSIDFDTAPAWVVTLRNDINAAIDTENEEIVEADSEYWIRKRRPAPFETHRNWPKHANPHTNATRCKKPRSAGCHWFLNENLNEDRDTWWQEGTLEDENDEDPPDNITEDDSKKKQTRVGRKGRHTCELRCKAYETKNLLDCPTRWKSEHKGCQEWHKKVDAYLKVRLKEWKKLEDERIKANKETLDEDKEKEKKKKQSLRKKNQEMPLFVTGSKLGEAYPSFKKYMDEEKGGKMEIEGSGMLVQGKILDNVRDYIDHADTLNASEILSDLPEIKKTPSKRRLSNIKTEDIGLAGDIDLQDLGVEDELIFKSKTTTTTTVTSPKRKMSFASPKSNKSQKIENIKTEQNETKTEKNEVKIEKNEIKTEKNEIKTEKNEIKTEKKTKYKTVIEILTESEEIVEEIEQNTPDTPENIVFASEPENPALGTAILDLIPDSPSKLSAADLKRISEKCDMLKLKSLYKDNKSLFN